MVGPSTQSVLRQSMMENQLWRNVRIKAASDPYLKELLDAALAYYLLKYDPPKKENW